MVVAMRETGKIITCTATECILGRMEESTMDSTSKTESTASECTLGLMDGSMKVSGRTVANMVKATTG